MATSASTLDLARAAYVAALDAARSAASLDLLRATSVSTAETYLDEESVTGSRGSSRGSRDRTWIIIRYEVLLNFIAYKLFWNISTDHSLH